MPLFKEIGKFTRTVSNETKRWERQARGVRDVFNPPEQDEAVPLPAIQGPAVSTEVEALIEEECEVFVVRHIANTPDISIPVQILANPVSLPYIGRGSYGIVYSYTDAAINCTVALKQIIIPTNGIEDVVNDVRNEVEINSKLRHENVVQYIGSCESNNNWFIVLEFMANGSLKSKLNHVLKSSAIRHNSNQSIMSEDLILKYTHEIVSGLVYLHTNGIIHRDLRSANVLLSSANTAKIADFGISKKLGTLSTKSGFSSVVGNTYWQAPELIKNEKDKFGRRIDVWSLGITILEMIYVTPPFMEEFDHTQYMFSLCFNRTVPEVPSFVRQEIRGILLKCLVFEVVDRSHSKDLFPWS